MRSHTPARLALLGLALAFALAPLAQAQILTPQIGGFGTQVKVGDDDYTPLMKGSKTWGIAEYDSGVKGDIRDACILLLVDMSAAKHPNVAGKTFPLNKDIRLTSCNGPPAGSLIGDDDAAEKMRSYTVLQNSTKTGSTNQFLNLTIADVDGSNAFNKGDYVYLANGTPNTGDKLVATEGPGAWTIRLTPALGLPAGTFVFAGDVDFEAYHRSGNGTKQQAFTISEREDKGWYLVPVSVAAGTLVAANSALPVGSLRLGILTTFGLQPNAIPTGVELAAPDDIEAGKSFPMIVTVTNTGARSGQGVVLTKIDGQVADVRLSPVLSPGESTKILVSAIAPHGGLLAIDVNDIFTSATAKGEATTTSSASAANADLVNLVHDLQARLSVLESQDGVAAAQAKGSPSLAPLAALGALFGVALLLRRRVD